MKRFTLLTIAGLSIGSAAVAQPCSLDALDNEIQTLQIVLAECGAPCSLAPLLNELETATIEIDKCERGNFSACDRAQSSLKNIKDYAQDVRICLAQSGDGSDACTTAFDAAKRVKDAAQELRVCITRNY